VESGQRRPVGKALVVIIALIIVVMMLLTPAVQGFIKDLISSPFQSRYPKEATFTLQRTFTVDANGGQVIDFAFDIPEPVNITQNGYDIQTISRVTYSPDPAWHGEKYGVDWIYWNGTFLSGNKVRTFTATYDVTVQTHIWNIDSGNSLTTSDIPESLKAAYLKDEWKMDMTSPAIVEASQDIVGDETNVYLILKDIYDWMTDNIKYPRTTSGGQEPQSALETLQTRVGDCDDQSILFCSLARAAGVPAWLQLGALYVNAEGSWGGHGWLQAYIPLESGGGENVTIDVVNNDFLVFRPNRFVDYTDDGNANHLEDYYFTFICNYEDSTYDKGSQPQSSEKYVSLSYVESEEKVGQGAVLDLGLMLAGTAPWTLRR
jgi:hypothetical protein